MGGSLRLMMTQDSTKARFMYEKPINYIVFNQLKNATCRTFQNTIQAYFDVLILA